MNDYFLYLKTTNKCQLKCSHCYTESDSTIRDEIDFDKAEEYIKKFCQEHKDDRIIASLHGGEPLLVDIDKVLKLVRNTKIGNIYWSATTNLVYELDDKKIELFKEFQQPDGSILVLTSYDLMIRFRNNQEELWKNNVKKLIDMGIQVKPIISFTSYMTKNNVKQIFDMFIDMGIKSMNFERITESGRAIKNPLRYSNKQLDDVLFDVYMMWNDEYRDKLSITLFEDIELAFNKKILVGCRARKCTENVITINPDGSICGCPNQPNRCYANIDNKTEYEYTKIELSCQEKKKDKRCYSCQYFRYCNGDCFQLKWDDDICPAPRKIYEFLLNKKEG